MEEKIGMVYRPSKLASPKHVIYGLTDSADDVVRYVGRTCLPQIRLDQHYQAALSAKLPSYKEEWIVSLAAEGRYPKMIVLDIVSRDDAPEAEKAWIAKYPAEQIFNNKVRHCPRPVTYIDRPKPDFAAQKARLVDFMSRHNLNQAELAKKLRVHYSTVSRWLDSSRVMRKQTIALLESFDTI